MTNASAVSRVLGEELDYFDRKTLDVFGEDGKVYVRGWNGTKQSAARIARARRALLARGYEVETVGATGLEVPLPDGPRMCRGPWIGGHAFRLTVSKASR